jgi:hypothetical protein
VAYDDRLAAPFEVDGHLIQVAGGRIATHDGTKWTVEPATGPTEAITAAASVGGKIHLLAGDELWRAP